MILSIGESRPHENKLGANAIMGFEGTDFSHTFISWKDQYGLRWVAEMRGGGMRICSNDTFKRDNHVVNIYQYELPEDKLEQVVAYIWGHSYVSYSNIQLAGLAYMRAANCALRNLKTNRRVPNPFKNGECSQICVELCLNAVRIAKDIIAAGDIENYGLLESRVFLKETCDRTVDTDKLSKINSYRKVV